MGKPTNKTLPHAKSASESTKKRHRWRPGTVAKREIARLQKGVDLLIRRAPFRRLIKEIGDEVKCDDKDGFRIFESAKKALQHAAEAFVIDYFIAGDIVATQATGKPVLTLKPRHTRAANNAALRFPGRPHDYSFAERREAMKHMPRTTPKKKKKKKKTTKSENKGDKGEKSENKSEKTVAPPQATSLLGQFVSAM